jgi:hypothetical protein
MGARKLAVNEFTESFVQGIHIFTSKPLQALAHQLAIGVENVLVRPRVRRVVKETASCPFF